MAATFTKLKNGDWGIKVDGKAKEGTVVTVTKKDGTSSQETVAKVIWSGSGVSICAIVQKPRLAASKEVGTTRERAARGRSARQYTGCSCGSYEGGDGKGFDNACNRCQFDEFDN